jgi:hypothetical protein
MNLENGIKEVIDNAMNSGMIEKAIKDQMEKCVNKAVEEMFGNWGKATKIIEKKIEEVMVPQLEKYDYSEHIVKLDSVLTEIMKNTTVDNAKILGNFKKYMVENTPKEIKMSEIFEKYCEFVSENASSDNLEIDYDDEVTYEPFEVTYELDKNETRSWGSYERGILIFECEHDGEMNFQASVRRWESDEYWKLDFESVKDLRSLRDISKFEIFLTKLDQNFTHIIMDEEYGNEEITLEQRPEPDYC